MRALTVLTVAVLLSAPTVDDARAQEALASRDASLPSDFSSQQASRQRRARRDVPRILIYPSPPRLVRRCVDWYAVERRASGPTVVPHMRCWWARS